MTAPAPLGWLAERAQLDDCPDCGALPGACLARLVGPWRDVCCPACKHHPELPHRYETTHTPDVCAAWADGRRSPRGVACPEHWEPAAYRQWRAEALASAPVSELPPLYSDDDLIGARQLYREEHGAPPRRPQPPPPPVIELERALAHTTVLA